jgi:hypothetical protein
MPSDTPGIWPPYEAFYIQSMLFSADSALKSADHVSQTISQTESVELQLPFDHQRLLNELQNVVVQGAALSRYFWPSKNAGLHEDRARHLRMALGIGDESPLKPRDLRNAIEHFDEQLDNYLRKDITGQIFPEYVGLRPLHDGVPLHLFRGYYVDAGVFTLLGREYEIQPIVDEIVRLHNALSYSEEQGGRLQQSPHVTE